MTEPLVDARNLYRFFHAGDEEILALRGVTIQVSAGEFIAIKGPSGSGKSTLLSCLAGLDEPDGGVVRLAGQAITRRDEITRAQIRRQHCGILFQSDNLISHLNVKANLRLIQRLAGKDDARARDHLLDQLGLGEREHAIGSELSGGELARAGLACALVNDPQILFADEPTGEVDAETEIRVLELLRAEAQTGRAVVVVTHSDAVSAAATRTIEIIDGKVAA